MKQTLAEEEALQMFCVQKKNSNEKQKCLVI